MANIELTIALMCRYMDECDATGRNLSDRVLRRFDKQIRR